MQERHHRRRERHLPRDVFVERDIVTTIGTHLSMPADRTIDAYGRYVIPGGIDATRIWTCPSAVPLGRRLRVRDACRGVRRHDAIMDFAIQYTGRRCTTPGRRG